jgi:predicted TIM-barrel fold metal-dependent hydrolase
MRARIDCHAHVLPPAYADSLVLPNGGRFPVPPAPLERLDEMMRRWSIDAAVISTGPPGAYLGDLAQGRELARLGNDGIAEIVANDPARFAGLAILPLPDVDAALDELARALDELRLDGVLLVSNVAGTYLGDTSLDPLFDELHRRGAYVFVHPGFPPHVPPLEHPIWLYEFPFETVRATVNLIYSGTLERCPGIRLQLSHLGGSAPFLAHRIASLAEREPALAEDAPAGALEYLRRIYYDTGLANNAPGIAATLEVTSLEHIVFGTDWPYLALPADGDDPTPGLATLTAEQRSRIESRHAGALIPRWR